MAEFAAKVRAMPDMWAFISVINHDCLSCSVPVVLASGGRRQTSYDL